jgi:hypothetical protein
VGTVAYLAPEQVAGEPVTTAADVYSWGLVLLEALTGERAYPGPSVESALARLNRPPHVPDTLPPGWRELLVAMTLRDPRARPSAAEVAARLRDVPLQPTATAPAGRAFSPRVALVGTAAAFLLLVGAAAWSSLPEPGRPAPVAADRVAGPAATPSTTPPVAAPPVAAPPVVPAADPGVTPAVAQPVTQPVSHHARHHHGGHRHHYRHRHHSRHRHHRHHHGPGRHHAPHHGHRHHH